MKLSLNRTTICKLIVHGIELHTTFQERENKQKNAKFQTKNWELSFLSPKIALVMRFYGKRKIIKLRDEWLVTMFTNKYFNKWFQLCLLFNPFQNILYIFDDFLSEFYVKQFL